MKPILSFSILALVFSATLSFTSHTKESIDLVGTKWISPVNDTSYASLCFTSERHVMYNDGSDDWHFEVGYTIHNSQIEINVHGGKDLKKEEQLILTMEDGVLSQLPGQKNNFPRHYLQVPDGQCR